MWWNFIIKKKRERKCPMGVVDVIFLAIGGEEWQLPWLLWRVHLIVIAQTMFSYSTPQWCQESTTNAQKGQLKRYKNEQNVPRSQRGKKIFFFLILLFWRPSRKYCLNMAASKGFFLKMWQLWRIFFQKSLCSRHTTLQYLGGLCTNFLYYFFKCWNFQFFLFF